jgi:membrane protease YdiL (CAAX protease family)
VKAAAVGGLVLAVFVLRPLLAVGGTDPTPWLIALFGVLLAVGLLWRVEGEERHPPLSPVALTLLGVAAFALGRAFGGGHAPAPFALRMIVLNVWAALAEEAFFRRFLFAVIRPAGPVVAVVGSATLFALAHVSVYGWWVLPLDFAAGLVLSWQRWAGGTWKVPALTHAVANVLVLW